MNITIDSPASYVGVGDIVLINGSPYQLTEHESKKNTIWLVSIEDGIITNLTLDSTVQVKFTEEDIAKAIKLGAGSVKIPPSGARIILTFDR